MKRLLCVVALLAVSSAGLWAEDWPEFRGAGRGGIWTESGILESFPAGGLDVLWRTPVKGGYSGAAVARGRVFLTDFTVAKGLRGTERALALDERTGRVLWTHEWDAHYAGLMWAHGPRATPTVDGDRVYVLGAMGVLHCLDVETGRVLWKKDYVAEYNAPVSMWGIAGAPLVEDGLLIAVVNGEPDALVIGFDKRTGEEVWRSLPSMGEPGVNHLIVITAGGTRQLIHWSPSALYSLDPATGHVYWSHPWRVGDAMNLALPVQYGSTLLVSHFSRGSRLFALDETRPMATEIWRGTSESEILSDGLHSLYATPVVYEDHIYGICSYGQFRCLRVSSGERVWETQAATKERARWASGSLVRNGDRVFINNDRGELVMARLTPKGYQEIDRTQLIKPTTPPGVRRQLGAVHVAHPAYANRNLYVRNDEEIIAYSLAARGDTAAPAAPAPVLVTEAPPKVDADRVVHVQYMPGLPDQRRLSNPTGTAYSTLNLLSGGGAHAVMFTTDVGVVLVNTKQAGWGGAMQDAMALVTNEAVTTIINTQPDPDYTGNNDAFPTTVQIIAHDKTKAAMATLPPFTGDGARFLPGRTYSDSLSLLEGRDQIDLRHFGPAHTDGDTVVVFPTFRLAYVGDLYPAKALPLIDTTLGGSAVAFADTLERAVAGLEDVESIVPGRADPAHKGNLLTGLPSYQDLQEYAEFYRDFLTVVTEAMNAGRTVDETVASLTLPDRYDDYDLANARTVIQAVFDELRR